MCALAWALMTPAARAIRAQTLPAQGHTPEPAQDHALWHGLRPRLVWVLMGYGCFGMGYIGYMTFVIALLRQQGVSQDVRTLFYGLLGVGVVLSARLWARLLDRHRDGKALAQLNALLGIATLLAALTTSVPLLILSGALFGSVFLSVVASTTAFVRHNLPEPLWVRGIGLFTVVFAWGQIVGPTMVGLIADGPGGLTVGLLSSAACLWMGTLLAWRQKSLLPLK